MIGERASTGLAARRARGGCIVLCAAALFGCPRAPAPPVSGASDPAHERESALVIAAPPPVEPIEFFERSCANCHGPYGTFYGEEFARGLDDAELKKVVLDMVIGPARASLDDASLGALVAFHRQLADAEQGPFVALTRAGEDEIGGEVSPGARVTVLVDGRTLEARVDGHTWSARLVDSPERSLIIRASFPERGATTELDVSTGAWSHGEPRAGPGARRGGGA